MEILSIENTYIKEFTAEILNIIEKDNQYHIELDKTFFYPGSKALPCDSGFINDIPVLSVYCEAQTLFHVMAVKPIKIHRVKCVIDFEKRFDYLQQHLGEHILATSVLELYNAKVLNSKVDPLAAFLDIDKVLDNNEIVRIEEAANRIIHDNLEIETLHPTSSELKKILPKKSSIKHSEKITLIRIDDHEHIICNEMHLKSTIEVQAIKIIKISKIPTGTRIEFICGKRAIEDCLAKYTIIDKITKTIGCSKEELLEKLENLTHELKKANTDKALLKAEVIEYEVQSILNNCNMLGDVKIVKSVYESKDLKYLTSLATRLTSFSKVIVLFGIKTEELTYLLFMKSKTLKALNMNLLLKDAISLIDGKGGGSDFSAQGAGKNNNNLNSCIDYAYKKVTEALAKE